jgi:outer membrane biogenesis lipoprotein LolB
MNNLLRILICTSLVLLTACTGESREPGDHVWKAQTDALQKARDVEKVLQQRGAERKREIDAQSQ